MYNLDKKTTRKDVGTRDFFQAMVSGGYLMSIPNDPGQGTDSFRDYQPTAQGNGVTCKVHGPVTTR